MVPPEFTNFFLGSLGAGAALVGLLFVAISIAPERTVMKGAPLERQAVAVSPYTALLNPFFVSLFALIPHANLGWMTIGMSLVGVSNCLVLGWSLFRQLSGWQSVVRRAMLTLGSLALYGFELHDGVLLLQSPTVSSPIYDLASVLRVFYGLGLLRAWQLIGASRFNISDWFNPLHDVEDREATTNTDSSQSVKRDYRASMRSRATRAQWAVSSSTITWLMT